MSLLKCPECKQPVDTGEKICKNCGYPLSQLASTTMNKWHCVNCGQMTSSLICSHCSESSAKKSPEANSPPENTTLSNSLVKTKFHKKSFFLFLFIVVVLSAITLLTVSVIIPNIKYNHAKELLQNKNYIAAFSAFEELRDYKNSEELAKNAGENVCYTLSVEDIISSSIGNNDAYIEFGDESWNILAIEDDKALLLSNRSICNLPYNEENTDVTWQTCTLRKYLNEEYYKTFSDEERAMIVPIDNTVSGDSITIEDKIFLLSSQEAKEYESKFDSEDLNSWWLRSPGKSNNYAACITKYGAISEDGFEVTRSGNGVRPALWIRISSTEEADEILSQIGFSVTDDKATIHMGGYQWRILDIVDNELLVITDDIVQMRMFPAVIPSWYELEAYECSGIKEYLNEEFANCFTKEEKLKISTHDTNLGEIFLLSSNEVDEYFGDDSQYDKPIQSYQDLYYDYNDFIRDGIRARKIAEYKGKASDWWLRDVGETGPYVVSSDGETYSQSDDNIAGIRPAMWIKLIDTNYSQTPIVIDQNILSNIGLTYGVMCEKYGGIKVSDFRDGGRYFIFENNPGLYFFEDAPGSGTASNGFGDEDIDENSVCFSVQTEVKNLFNDFNGLKTIEDAEQELGVSIECFDDEEAGGYSCTFYYQNYFIYISLKNEEKLITADSWATIKLKE